MRIMTEKKHILIILSIIIILIQGCDWLELLPPDGLVVDEYWKSKEEVEATLLGAYKQFATMDEKLFLYGELRADMIKSIQAPNYQQLIKNSNIFSNNLLCDWEDFYKIINYCNSVIAFAPNVLEVDQTFTKFQMTSFTSEAIFLRSLTYFYLVRIFKDVPYITNPTIDDNVDFFVKKTNGKDILSFLIEDLNAIKNTIPPAYSSPSKSKARATKAAVNALLADISLWNFDYELCISNINEIEESNLYFLMSIATWFEIFLPGNSLEGIFELQFDGNGEDNSMYDYTYNLNYYAASDQAIEMLDPEISGEQIRGPGSISDENLNFRIWKYAGGAADQTTTRSSTQQEACNFIIYRYSDIQLMKAEALSQLGQFDEAENIINEIRSRARLDPVSISSSPEAFEDFILQERAKELAFEGKRWYDLMRMGRRNNYSRKNDLIEIILQDAPSTQKLVLASKLSNPLGWYLPIYEAELERNLNLTQNPFYDKDL
jgi:hypothetical protein